MLSFLQLTAVPAGVMHAAHEYTGAWAEMAEDLITIEL